MRLASVIIGFGLGLWLSAQSQPDVLIITVDALRRDRLSCEGYTRATTPVIDRLMAQGVRFSQARTIEPLTAPALVSMVTSLYPHHHGATRNGVRAYPGLASLPKILEDRGYQTGAMVGNWTLKDELCGLAEHFGVYRTIITKKRWFGLLLGEADAADLTQGAEAWLEDRADDAPFFLWVHFIEPHAPYVWHGEMAAQLGYQGVGKPSKAQRYDSEIAFVDREIGRLLELVHRFSDNLLTVFSADHGESLGEHNYWGHGRNLYEPGMVIPLGFAWEGVVRPSVCIQPATIMDIAPTILGLLEIRSPQGFEGRDWSDLLRGRKTVFPPRTTFFQAHKGAVQAQQAFQRKRRRGLLQVGLVDGGMKQIYRIKDGRVERYDLLQDPRERAPLAATQPSAELTAWMNEVVRALEREPEENSPDPLNEEDLQVLEGLGYIK